MALAKKSSRPISHNGKQYRFVIFGNSGWNDLTVQSAQGFGQKLSVMFPVVKWTENGPENVITPKNVSSAIQAGLKFGWKPQVNAKTMRLRFEDGKFKLHPPADT